jgi:hypothetical protein
MGSTSKPPTHYYQRHTRERKVFNPTQTEFTPDKETNLPLGTDASEQFKSILQYRKGSSHKTNEAVQRKKQRRKKYIKETDEIGEHKRRNGGELKNIKGTNTQREKKYSETNERGTIFWRNFLSRN